MKRDVEEYVTRKIVALLDRTYGPGRAIVSVDATLNFDEVRRTVQDLLPPHGSNNVRRRRQTTGGLALTDPNSAFDDATATARGASDTEYDYGRRVEQVVAAPGGVTRLSIGVIVPGTPDIDAEERILDLVRVAAGINDERGDVVVVQRLDALGGDAALATPAVLPAPVEPKDAGISSPPTVAVTQPWWKGWYVWVSGGVLLLVLLIVAVRSLRGAESGRLSQEERARLLADVKASLGMKPAGGTL
jgi:flagellar M-ring protein FliF